jgi:hypothetical protein
LTRWLRIWSQIFSSTLGSWDNLQWIFQKHWKCPYWVALKRDHTIFYDNQSIRGLFGFESTIFPRLQRLLVGLLYSYEKKNSHTNRAREDGSFQNCFWNLFSTAGLSQICKIKNVWKLLIPLSRITLVLSSGKSSWSLKISFWEKNCQKWSWTFFRRKGFHGFGTSCLDFLKPWSSEIHWGLSQEPDVLEKIWDQIRNQRVKIY